MASVATEPSPSSPAYPAIDRWPTGAKVFLILSIALLPIAVIAVFATLQTTRLADTEARARLRVAASESTHALSIELTGDMTALRAAAQALGRDPADAPSCARAQGVFAQQFATGTRFVVLDRAGRALCGEAFPGAEKTAALVADGGIAARLDPPAGLQLAVSGAEGARAAAIFPAEFLSRLSRPSGFTPPFAAALVDDDRTLTLASLDTDAALERRETIRTGIGIGGLTLSMQVRSAPISSPMVIAMLLPLIMWAAAASIAWFVVDRLLIRPLRDLRRDVAAFTPGDELVAATTSTVPAQEIRDLGETFRAISRTVALHEAGLAAGLVRQTKLTREVHHRVKNNLQVIASLINLHSRAARSIEATEAYASIQRRVDALAVVHRNHYAELEENRGLSLRRMLGELASNLRATAPEDTQLGIVVDVEPLCVNQDVAVAVAFLVTEAVELAMGCDRAARIRLSVKPGEEAARAVLRISSPALIVTDDFQAQFAARYGRVLEGLSRQLRAKLHHDPLVGAFEIAIAVLGRE